MEDLRRYVGEARTSQHSAFSPLSVAPNSPSCVVASDFPQAAAAEATVPVPESRPSMVPNVHEASPGEVDIEVPSWSRDEPARAVPALDDADCLPSLASIETAENLRAIIALPNVRWIRARAICDRCIVARSVVSCIVPSRDGPPRCARCSGSQRKACAWSIYAAFTRGYVYRGDAQLERDYADQGLKVSALAPQQDVTKAYAKNEIPEPLLDRAAKSFAAMADRVQKIGAKRWFEAGDWVPPCGEASSAACVSRPVVLATSASPTRRPKSSLRFKSQVASAALKPPGPVLPRPPLLPAPASGPIFVTNGDQPRDGSGVRWPLLPPALQHSHFPQAARVDVLASLGYTSLPDPPSKYLTDALSELRANVQPRDMLETSYLMARYLQAASVFLLAPLGDLLDGPSAAGIKNAIQCIWMAGHLYRASVCGMPAESVLPYSRHRPPYSGRKRLRAPGDFPIDRDPPARGSPPMTELPDAKTPLPKR